MAFFKKKEFNPAVTALKPEYIIAGLGNPGKEYEYSRHNTGFLCLDILCNQYHISTDRVKYKSLCTTVKIEGHSCLIMRPQTYMNNSGEAIREAADFYKIPPQKVIVIYDDISLPVGSLRIRLKGSAGGHNGIKSIIYHLGTEEFPRLKLGVGERKDADSDLKDYVLGRFSKEELAVMRQTMENAVQAVALLVQDKPNEALNRYSH